MANVTNILANVTSTDPSTPSELFSLISNIHLLADPIYNSILLAILILISSYITAYITHFILEKVVYQLTKKTETKIDDLIVEHTKKPFYFLIIFLGLRVALYPLLIPLVLEKILIQITYSLIIATVFYIIARSINIVIDEWGLGVAKPYLH